MSLEIVK